jgi:ABC-2 type transport system ATP-binding protein
LTGFAIETHDLTRRFGARTAVYPLGLRVPEDGIYGFLGPNGAGKTTTIRMLLGLIQPDVGSIQLFSESLNRGLLARVGALVEMPSLYAHLTGRENLEVTRRLIDAPRSRIDHVLAVVRMTDSANRLVREYSMGMKQRLGLALALLNEPKLLILDEPTNGLDPAGIHETRELLRRMPEQNGVTVFLSSHLLSEVEQIAGSVGIIHEGRMVFQGALAELRQHQSRQLRIGSHDAGRALQILHEAGFRARLDEPDFIGVGGGGIELEPAEINRMLTLRGCEIFHLSIQQDSLEDVFLSLTGSTRA